jgi:hypothetical protein
METVKAVIEFATVNGAAVAGSVVMILMGIIAIAEMIPGDQPEKTLKKIVAVLEKVSKK